MPEFTEYEDGQLCWVDLQTTDMAAAVPFYKELFGWDSFVDPNPDFGGYTLFTKNGKVAAAAAPMVQPGIPSHWNTYLKVSNIAYATKEMTDAGCKVLMNPFQIGDQGWVSVIQDPAGVVTNLWKPDTMIGAEIASEENTWIWSIHTSNDPQSGLQPFADIFKWEFKPSNGGPADYYSVDMHGTDVGGFMKFPESTKGVQPAWSVIFAVESCDEVTEKARSLGGQVFVANDTSMPGLVSSIVADPTGGTFTIAQMQ